MERERKISFVLRELHNQIRLVIHKTAPMHENAPKTQLQGGILGYLYHHQEQPVYQRDLEKEFRISGATATNTLRVMEREGLIVRRALDKDARLKRIQMTKEAFQGHMQVEAHMEMMNRKMLEGMSENEVAELYRLLGILFRNLEQLAEEGSAGTEETQGKASPEESREGDVCSEQPQHAPEIAENGNSSQRK